MSQFEGDSSYFQDLQFLSVVLLYHKTEYFTFYQSFNQQLHSFAISTAELCCHWLKDQQKVEICLISLYDRMTERNQKLCLKINRNQSQHHLLPRGHSARLKKKSRVGLAFGLAQSGFKYFLATSFLPCFFSDSRKAICLDFLCSVETISVTRHIIL